MKTEKKKLFENIIVLGALKIVSYIIPLISLPYLSRILSTEHFGLIFFAFAFMQYFVILTDYGFGLSATREIAVNRHNQNTLSNIFSSVICIKFILLILSAFILLIFILTIPKLRADWLVFLLSFFMIIGNAIYPIWFFQGMESMKYITFLNILTKTIFLLLIFVFVKNDNDYIVVPLFNSLGFIISGIIGFIFAIKNFNIKFYIPKLSSIKKQFKYSSEFFISRVSVEAYTSTNTFCLGLIASNAMVALYVAADKIYVALNSLMGPLNQAIYPYVAKNKDIKFYKKMFKIIVIVNTLICIFVYFFAKDIISIFYGENLVLSYKILRILILGTLIGVPHVLLGYPLLGGMGHTDKANRSVIYGSVFHVLVLFLLFLINKISVYTIAVTATITEYVIFAMRYWWVRKYKLLNE